MRFKPFAFVLCLGAGFAAAALSVPHGDHRSASGESADETTGSIRASEAPKPLPKGGGYYRVGEPYVVAGRTYVPREQPDYRAQGIASWYGDYFHGRLTANGERYNMHAISAAHPTLPLPSYVRVTNLDNNLSLVVRVNDRGPFHDGRIIDMSVRAAKLLGFYERGLARVRVEYLGPARLEGSDDTRLAATLRREPRPLTARSRHVRESVSHLAPVVAGQRTESPQHLEVIALFEVRPDHSADSVDRTPSPASSDIFPPIIFD